MPSAISPRDTLQVLRHAQAHQRAGDLTVRNPRTQVPALRPSDSRILNLTPDALNAPYLEEKPHDRPRVLQIQELEAAAGSLGGAEEDEVWERVFPRYKHRNSLHAKFGRLQRAGILTVRHLFPDHMRLMLLVLSRRHLEAVAEENAAEGRMPPVHTQVSDTTLDHHLQTLQAAIWILNGPDTLGGAGTIMGYETDEMIRHAQQAGAKTVAGQTYDDIPDARLTVMTAVGPLVYNIETLSHNYKDDQIRAKLVGLPWKNTIYFADSDRVFTRTENLLGGLSRDERQRYTFHLRRIDVCFS